MAERNPVDAGAFAGKMIGGFISGVLLSRVMRWATDKWRGKYGLPPLPPAQLSVPALEGASIVISSVYWDNPASPIVIGLSSGRIVDQYAPLLKKGIVLSGEKKLEKKKGMVTPADGWDVHSYDLKPTLSQGPRFILRGRQWTLEEIGKKLRLMVVSDTYNRVQEKNIPAGYRHPLVMYWAKKVIQDAGVRGDDPISVANAVTAWFRAHVPYCFDPQGPNEDEDFFWHPHCILETLDPKTGKTLPFDCDCVAILLASFLMALGFKPIFLLFAQKDPNLYGHVITAMILPPNLKDKNKFYPYYPQETTQTNKPIDYMPRYLRRCVIEVIPGTIVKKP